MTDRNIRFSGQPPGNFGMMPTSGMVGPYAQPGIQRFPMMQHGMMMVPPGGQIMQQQPRMFPVQQMRPVRMRPGFAPPPYTQQMAENFRQRAPAHGQRKRNLSAEEMKKQEDQQRKEKQFLAQKQRLQQFGKAHGHVDPDKLIESMFGKTEKVKPKTEQRTKVEEFSDDSFGDFMSGPGTLDVSQGGVQNSQESANQNQYSSGDIQETKEEKKDLMSMMMECSDLTAPNKAKTFHKPALKEIHRTHHTHHSTHTFHQSQQARQWTAQEEEDLSALFTVQAQPATAVEQPSGQQGQSLTGQVNTEPVKFELPHWCCDDSKVPDLYKQVYEAATVDDKIMTERLYPILILSGLPKETLGQIWALANRTTPGQLIKEELYLILALVAFAQNNFKTLTPDLLNKCPQPPIPFLGQAQPQGPPTTQQPARPPAGPVPQQPSPFGAVPPGTAMPNAVPPIGQGVQPYTVPPSGTAVGLGQQVGQTGKQLATELAADDDFADFQTAPASIPASGSPPKPAGKKKQEVEYLYEVPKPAEAEKLAGPLSPEMMYSNVRNYFGSDDSSVSASPQRQLLTGPSTPNSFEDDFDDFKSADSKPSDSSQFTSSEQSENEDFKVFESYLDDFERKKAEQQESPLHRPVSKSSIPLPRTADTQPPVAIPAVKNLWSKPATTVTGIPTLPNPTPNVADVPGKATGGIGLAVGAEMPKGVVDLQLGSSPSKSSESDFADFQQAPVIEASQEISSSVKVSKSAASLIGEEDKYAALRSLDFGTEAASENPAILAGQGKVSKEEEEENWADFQGVEGDTTASTTTQDSNTDNKDKILSLFASSTPQQSEPDWADFQSGSAPAPDSTTAFAKSESDWSAFNSAAPTVSSESDWSNFSSATVNQPMSSMETTQNIPDIDKAETAQDDWADFQGPTMAAESQSSNTTDTQGLVSVKKENLQKGEILGLFKVRETSELPADLKLYNSPKLNDIPPTVDPVSSVSTDHSSKPEAKTTKISVSSLDEDPFRVPPPMDDGHDDDEFGEYNRGYDIEDYAQPQQLHPIENKKYPIHGMGVVASRTTTKPSEERKIDHNIYADIMALDQEEKSANDYSVTLQDKLAPAISEDSQSVSSLELPFTKTRLHNLQEQDDQSISSNEFGNYEARKGGTPTNMESKSVDSLDLIKGDYTEEQGSSGESPERELVPDKQQASIKPAEGNMPSVTQSSGPMPVLGDRYSSILEDVPGSDKHAYEWQRCLDNCYKMIKDANNIFNSISSSSVCNEVIRSEQGSEYVQGIVEIYRVVCKITAAMGYTALSTEKLKQVIKDIDLAWNNLTAFLVGGNLMPDDNSLSFKNAVLKSDDSLSQMKACGVCLLNVDVPCKNFNRDEDCAKLTYGRRQYHASCANFWVNCVDSLLPALKLPELL